VRRIQRAPTFEDRLLALQGASPQLPAAVAGLEFVLERQAQHGMIVGDTNFSSWPVHLSGDETYKVIYLYDDETVTLVGLFRAVAPAEA
jgi:hypothetical protein